MRGYDTLLCLCEHCKQVFDKNISYRAVTAHN
jgi:hypothetical protein